MNCNLEEDNLVRVNTSKTLRNMKNYLERITFILLLFWKI